MRQTIRERWRRSMRTSQPSGRRRARGDVRADINVTPLVDVVLVLLIIFMVVGPAIAQGIDVELPRTVHHASKPDDGKDLVVAVTEEGQLFLRTERVLLFDLPGLIERERQRSPERKVYIKGDDALEYGKVREVMEAIHKGARIEELLLVTRARGQTD
jgi:biopolymer transport protein TolR